MPQISKVYQVSEERFKEIVAQANSYSDCLRELGLGTKGGSSTDTLKRRIKELECDISHFGTSTQVRASTHYIHSIEEILVENSTYANIASLKKRILNEGLLEYKCAECGLAEWRN